MFLIFRRFESLNFVLKLYLIHHSVIHLDSGIVFSFSLFLIFDDIEPRIDLRKRGNTGLPLILVYLGDLRVVCSTDRERGLIASGG